MDGGGIAVPPQNYDRRQHVQSGVKLQPEREKNQSHRQGSLAVVDVKQWRLTANPKAEALWRMTETAGKKSRGQVNETQQHLFSSLIL